MNRLGCHDDDFLVDKYLFKVKPPKRADSCEDSSSLDSFQDPDNSKISLKAFVARIDEWIEAKSKDPTYDGAISGHYIKDQAKELWKMIKGAETVDEGDQSYKKYLLNVFTRAFPENPLLNSHIKCGIKPIVAYVHNTLLDGDKG